MSNSTHKVEVVPIALENHPNANSLSIVNVFGGYTCVVRTADWEGVAMGAYVPPDSLVDTTRPEFSFLSDKSNSSGKHRVKAKKLRGVVSYGMLVHIPIHCNHLRYFGADLANELGVAHYEPPIAGVPNSNGGGLITGGESATPPDLVSLKYDVDSFRRYHEVFVPGEPIFITEKIHGCSARYVYSGGKIHCGSRSEWKKEFPSYSHLTMDYLRQKIKDSHKTWLLSDEEVEEKCRNIIDKCRSQESNRNLWWKALDAADGLESWCRNHEGYIVHGEVFGNVQTFKYGAAANRPYMFAAFDIMKEGRWLDSCEALSIANGLQWVPILQSAIPYSFDEVVRNSDGPSIWPGANHYREGCVVKPMKERFDAKIGRVQLKCVGATYLEKD